MPPKNPQSLLESRTTDSKTTAGNGAIVFGIRIFWRVSPGWSQTTRFHGDFGRVIEHLPEAQRRYKGLDACWKT